MNVRLPILSLLLVSATVLLNATAEPLTIFGAVRAGNYAAVQRFIEQDATVVNQQDIAGNTPLHLAAYYGDEAVVRLLLENGAAVNQPDSLGSTPLYWAALNGREAVARLLLENGAAVNQPDNNDYTPLHWAAKQGQEAVARVSLEHGAAVNQTDNYGHTPLHCAAEKGHPAVVQLLTQWAAMQQRAYQEARLAFCEALHLRLGANSPANILPGQQGLQDILQYIRPSDFYRPQNTQSYLHKYCNIL